jgi:hypothetical protein
MNQYPNQNYQQQPQQPQYQGPGIEAQIKAILSSTRGWLMFLGIINIIFASVYTLITLGIGIVVMWVPFLMGIFLISAASKIKNYLLLGNPMSLVEYHKQMKSFFVTKGVLIIIGFALSIIGAIVIAVLGITLTNNFTIPW